MTDFLAIGTHVLADGETVAPDPWRPTEALPVRVPGEEGTLLAVVPLPGTGTSLAIVGYAVSTSDAAGAFQAPSEGAPDTPAPGLRLDHVQRRVWINDREIELTYQEFELLAYLAGHPSTVFSRAHLLERVWHRSFETDSRTVDVHVSRLRNKLGTDYGRCLVTEYRIGYQFRPPV
jgi:DNA-binding response OmpR family regulator